MEQIDKHKGTRLIGEGVTVFFQQNLGTIPSFSPADFGGKKNSN